MGFFTETLDSEEKAQSLLIEASGAVRNGTELYIDDDMMGSPLDADDTDARTYVILGGKALKGTDEKVPANRAVFVTEYRGMHVHPEDYGYLVNVPVKGTRTERKSLEWWAQPERPRYYSLDEISAIDLDDSLRFAHRAAARGIYEVANGLNILGHSERFETMRRRANEKRAFAGTWGDFYTQESNTIWKRLHEASPELDALIRRQRELMLGDIEENKAELAAVTEQAWQLRDKTLEKLGLTERFRATLTRVV